MARLSDIIEDFIKDLMDQNEEDELQIQRNELANHFSCAPSQINYVLTTRFTTNKGYYIESRRGGGGCIIIKKAQVMSNEPLNEIIINKIGDSITFDSSMRIIAGLFEAKLISEREAMIIKAAINDRALIYSNEDRNKLRADILKSILIIIL